MPDNAPPPLAAVLADLGIAADALAARGLVPCAEAAELEVVQIDEGGRDHRLAPAAAAAWRAMREAAAADGIPLKIISAFRSIARQAEIVRAKLERGQSLADILCVSAPPGYSEHHSGLALDIGTDDSPPLETVFEETAAFAWLSANARRFGFSLSFPRGNPQGYAYEPWHWRHGAPITQTA
jgi:D-alanyl-D-alanine carboxypeptidase